jgi:hypothetical protein
MAKTPKNHRKAWSRQEVKELRQLVRENTPTRVIGLKLERSEDAIYGKAQREGISLKQQTNRRIVAESNRLSPPP